MTSSEINIGILIVHGIGDQKQFTCLREAAQNIVDFLKSEINEGYIKASITVNRATTGTFKSLHPTWQDGDEAPITIHIERTGQIYVLHLREVWWADLDRPQNLGKVMGASHFGKKR